MVNDDFEKIGEKPVRIKLKSGQNLIGTLQKRTVSMISQGLILILTVEKRRDLLSSLGEAASGKTYISLTQEQIETYFERVPLAQIDSLEVIETEVHGISLITQSGKEIQLPDFQVQLMALDIPGMVKVQFQIPGHNKIFEIGERAIKKGMIEIPVSVAFISYAREDEKVVAEITRNLNDNAVVTWFDQQSLIPGDDWEMRIEQAIEKADYFLLFLSRQTEEKIGYKNREIQFALKQQSFRPRGRIFVIPILLDDCTLPWDLRNFNWLKATDDGWFEKLIGTIAPWYAKDKT